MAWTTPRTWVTSEVVTASVMNTHLRDQLDAGFPYGTTTQTYTPQLTASTTDPTLGSGSTQTGRYYRIGRWVHVQLLVKFGTSGTAAGSGTYRVSLPINANSTSLDAGSGMAFDSSASQRYAIEARPNTASTVQMFFHGGNLVTYANPFAWAASDEINLVLAYEAA